MIEKILKIKKEVQFDFRIYANPKDELAYLFDKWVDYYQLKYSICKAINPKTILEVGVRYGYSAITFLSACKEASYLGIDIDRNSFGGSTGAINWAKKITQGFKAEFLIADSQQLDYFPGDFYDFIHIDGQQDGDGTFHDLELALKKAKYILVDGFFWTSDNMLSATYFLNKYKDFINYAFIIPGYAGELLIHTNERASEIRPKSNDNYRELQDNYDFYYYLNDCGGYQTFNQTGGQELDYRLSAIYNVVAPKQGENILDIGCGRGELSFAMANAGAKVVGIDYSKHAIDIAKSTYKDLENTSLKFCQADILGMNDEQKYDKVIAADLVEHLDKGSLEKLLDKVSFELLDCNGSFIIHTAPNKLYYDYEYKKKRDDVLSLGVYIPKNPRTFYEDLMHINEQTPAQLKRDLKKYFNNCIVWVTNLPDICGTLENQHSKENLMKGTSIFAIASNSEISKNEIFNGISQSKLNVKDLETELNCEVNNLTVNKLEILQIPITLCNKSSQKMVSLKPYPVYMSYHWLDESGNVFIHDGIRTPIKIAIYPDEVRKMIIDVLIPQQPGKYLLEITLVQEECFWFEQVLDNLPIYIKVTVN